MERQVLEMKNITKVYPNGLAANQGVDFSVCKGEIHALAGENGAGKTTLMKVLFGVETPDEGKILLNGQEVKINNPIEAIKHGIGMVHQHFMLVPSLTVAENIVLGAEPAKLGFVDFKRAIEITKEISKKYNLIVDPYVKVEDLPVGLKQKVEILKALLRGAKILILDEPTAVLTPQETKELFVELKQLSKNGHTIIFISHKLNEIKEICNRITILRHGRYMGVHNVADVSEQDISSLMVGRDVVLKIDKKDACPKETVLKVDGLSKVLDSGKKVLNNISFSVRAGEIVGIAGVEGNGQRELSEIITGLMPYKTGDIFINGETIKGKSIANIRQLKTSHISEDRMTFGVVAEASIKDNLISNIYNKKEHNKLGLMNDKYMNNYAQRLVTDFLIKCDDTDDPVRMLSGGNMQKVVVARECSDDPKLIIVNQPTRGIDVGAIEFVRKKLIELRDSGCAILLISADLNEVMELSDSLMVMSGGEVVAYIEHSVIDELELGEYMLGIKKQTQEEVRRAVHDS